MLAGKGIVACEFGVSPRDEAEIDDRDQIIFEELRKVIDYEIGTVRTEGFIV